MHFSVIIVIALVHFATAAYVPRVDPNPELATDDSDVTTVETTAGTLEARRGTIPIGQRCSRDSQCASSCCGFRTGKCAGRLVADLLDGGCGRGG